MLNAFRHLIWTHHHNARLSEAGALAHLAFFLLTGILWVLPAMAIIKWLMLAPKPKD